MRKNRFSPIPRLLAAILFLFTFNYLQAQYENGSLVGTIRDTSGAAVSGASVTITNNATAVSAQTTTNAAGDHQPPPLPLGRISILPSHSRLPEPNPEHLRLFVRLP